MINENLNIELIFSEFGPNRGDHGGINFTGNRLDPSFQSFTNFFKDAKIKIYTDIPENFKKYNTNKNVEIINVDISDYDFLDKENSRIGYRCSDYFRIKAMLESDSDICIYTDTDMFICSDHVYQALDLAKIFGLCLPANPRMLFEKDLLLGADAPSIGSKYHNIGMKFSKMHSFNASPIFFYTKHEMAKKMLETYCHIFEESPMRGPSAINLASIESKFFPCMLPFQWCVSRDNIDDEIILHVGKEQVAKKYFR